MSILPAKATTILLLGDSLSASYGMQASQGWVDIVQRNMREIDPAFTLLNASASGETTGGGRVKLDRLLAEHQVDILWIELGGNDGLRGYPIAAITDNLQQMITMAQVKNIKVILTQIKLPPNLGRRYRAMFEGIYPALTAQTGVNLMPFFIESIVLNPQLMQADLIHPNIAAQPLIADIVEKYLTQYPGVVKK